MNDILKLCRVIIDSLFRVDLPVIVRGGRAANRRPVPAWLR